MAFTIPEIQNALSEKLTTDDLGPGATVPREISEDFIDLVVGQADFLNQIDRGSHARRRFRIPKLDIDEFTRRGRGEGASTSRTDIDVPYVDGDAVEGSTLVEVTEEMVQEATTEDALADTIFDRLAQRFALDTQALAILGDEDATEPAVGGRMDADFRRQNDGFLKLAAESSMPQFSNSGNGVTLETLQSIDEAYPTDYSYMGEMAYMMSRQNYLDLRYDIGDSFSGSTAGYAAAMGQEEFTPGGHPVMHFQYWPDDRILLTPMENLHYGYYTEMESDVLTESDEIQDKRLHSKVRMWADDDFVLKNERAGVLATDVDPSASA